MRIRVRAAFKAPRKSALKSRRLTSWHFDETVTTSAVGQRQKITRHPHRLLVRAAPGYFCGCTSFKGNVWATHLGDSTAAVSGLTYILFSGYALDCHCVGIPIGSPGTRRCCRSKSLKCSHSCIANRAVCTRRCVNDHAYSYTA